MGYSVIGDRPGVGRKMTCRRGGAFARDYGDCGGRVEVGVRARQEVFTAGFSFGRGAGNLWAERGG